MSGEPRLNLISIQTVMVQRMLATDFEHFEKGPLVRDYMKSLLGTGVFNADGEKFSLLDAIVGWPRLTSFQVNYGSAHHPPLRPRERFDPVLIDFTVRYPDSFSLRTRSAISTTSIDMQT